MLVALKWVLYLYTHFSQRIFFIFKCSLFHNFLWSGFYLHLQKFFYMKTFLVSIDFSSTSENAAEYAIALTKDSPGVEIILYHVYSRISLSSGRSQRMWRANSYFHCPKIMQRTKSKSGHWSCSYMAPVNEVMTSQR